ncbi:MAG: FHA domain-containing protein [Planctomycetes bacterium]|nr:FHA domain-containing protein [Planctomycetota bacterium]
MPELRLEAKGRAIDLPETGRQHWLIGRGQDCDIIVEDPGVSRYHATVFRFHNRFFVIDHSLNGTHLARDMEDVSSKTAVPGLAEMEDSAPASNNASSNDTTEIAPDEFEDESEGWKEYLEQNKSHAAFRAEQIQAKLPRMLGYEKHALTAPKDLKKMLEMVYSAEDAENLASMGKLLHDSQNIVLLGNNRQYIKFTV